MRGGGFKVQPNATVKATSKGLPFFTNPLKSHGKFPRLFNIHQRRRTLKSWIFGVFNRVGKNDPVDNSENPTFQHSPTSASVEKPREVPEAFQHILAVDTGPTVSPPWP